MQKTESTKYSSFLVLKRVSPIDVMTRWQSTSIILLSLFRQGDKQTNQQPADPSASLLLTNQKAVLQFKVLLNCPHATIFWNCLTYWLKPLCLILHNDIKIQLVLPRDRLNLWLCFEFTLTALECSVTCNILLVILPTGLCPFKICLEHKDKTRQHKIRRGWRN